MSFFDVSLKRMKKKRITFEGGGKMRYRNLIPALFAVYGLGCGQDNQSVKNNRLEVGKYDIISHGGKKVEFEINNLGPLFSNSYQCFLNITGDYSPFTRTNNRLLVVDQGCDARADKAIVYFYDDTSSEVDLNKEGKRMNELLEYCFKQIRTDGNQEDTTSRRVTMTLNSLLTAQKQCL